MKELPFYRSICLKLILSFLIPVVCIIVLGAVSYTRASDEIVTIYRESSEQTMNMMQQYLDLIMSSEREEFKAYVGSTDLIRYYKGLMEDLDALSTKNEFTGKFRDKLNRDSKVSNIFVISDEGNSIYSSLKAPVKDAYSQFIRSPAGEIVRDSPYDWHVFGQNTAVDAAVNADTETYALRLVRKLNDIPQVLVVDISASAVREAMQSMDPGEDGYVVLVTGDGSEFFSYKDTAAEAPIVYGTDYYESARASEERGGSRTVYVEGEEFLFVYSRLESCDAMLATLIHSDTVLANTADIKSLTVVLTIVAAVIAGLLGTVISRRMSRTIHYILRQLGKVAKGDLTVHLTTKRKDEFGLLCGGVNDTVANVKTLIASVSEVSGQVGEAAAYVAETSGTFMETSQDIQNAVSEIEIGVNRLDVGSGDCLNQMDTLSGKIANVSSNAGEIEKLTSLAGATISSGISSVQGLTESAVSTTEITHNVITSIEELENKSRSISNIVSAINDIAEQTNLLSLNASIEAARAGDAGRGFAVVAEEIRRLADQCLVSSGQIAEIVDEIVAQTRDVVAIARQAETVVSSQSGAVEETTSSFRKIDRQVEELLMALKTITGNVQEMNGARNETLTAIESISAASTETAACSTSVYDAAGTQLTAIQTLDEAAQKLAARADSLIDMLSAFSI